MSKKGKLTTIEKYAIQHLKNENKTIEEICDAVDRPMHVVQKYIEGELEQIQENIAKAQTQQVVSPIKAKDLFLRSSKSGNKEHGVTIMTQQASELSDETRQNKKVINRHTDKNIYRISDGKILKKGDKI